MNNLIVRWRLYLNIILLSAVLLTSFQNCSENNNETQIKTTPLGIEIITE